MPLARTQGSGHWCRSCMPICYLPFRLSCSGDLVWISDCCAWKILPAGRCSWCGRVVLWPCTLIDPLFGNACQVSPLCSLVLREDGTERIITFLRCHSKALVNKVNSKTRGIEISHWGKTQCYHSDSFQLKQARNVQNQYSKQKQWKRTRL